MAISLVQNTHHAETTGSAGFWSSGATAYGSNNTAGNLLIATIQYRAQTSSTAEPTSRAVSDTQGNTWVEAVHAFSDSSVMGVSVWYCLNAKVGANSVTATFTYAQSSAWGDLFIAEYSGGGAWTYDNGATSVPVGGTLNGSNSIGPYTTTGNGDLIYTCANTDFTTTFTAGATPSNNAVINNNIGTNVKSGDEWGTQTSAGSITPTINLSYSGGPYGDALASVAFLVTSISAPTVTTQAASSIAITTATANGNITATGGANPTVEGVVWNTTTFSPVQGVAPSTYGTTVSSSGSFGTGAFTESLTGLTTGTTYYYAAYATNSVGTSYGSVVSFTTLAYPTVTTEGPSNIGTTACTGNGDITSLGNGGSNCTAEGFQWRTTTFATPANGTAPSGSYVSNSGSFGTGVFTAAVTGLTAATTYYICAFADGSAGYSWGAVQTFTTGVQPALVATKFTFTGLIW